MRPKTSVSTEKFWTVRLKGEKVASEGVSYRGVFETTSAPKRGTIYIPQMSTDVSLDEVDITPMERITVTTVITREL